MKSGKAKIARALSSNPTGHPRYQQRPVWCHRPSRRQWQLVLVLARLVAAVDDGCTLLNDAVIENLSPHSEVIYY